VAQAFGWKSAQPFLRPGMMLIADGKAQHARGTTARAVLSAAAAGSAACGRAAPVGDGVTPLLPPLPARCRPAVERVASRLAAGDGLGEAAAASAGAIPDVVAGMLLVGDRTGRLAEVLEETAKTLARSIARRRSLRAALAGPAIRLVVAVLAECGVLGQRDAVGRARRQPRPPQPRRV
jgi:hypothetical protein